MVGNWIGPPRDIYIRRLCQYSRPFPTTLVLPAERIDSRTGDATIAKRRNEIARVRSQHDAKLIDAGSR